MPDHDPHALDSDAARIRREQPLLRLWVPLPALELLDELIAADPYADPADDFALRLETWCTAVVRILRRHGAAIGATALPPAHRMSMHPWDADILRRWCLADARESFAPNPALGEVVASGLWMLRGPRADATVPAGVLRFDEFQPELTRGAEATDAP